MSIREELDARGITLPAPFPPVANYVRAVRTGNLIYTSGTGPVDESGSFSCTGRLGAELSVEDGYQAARLTAMNLLLYLEEELDSLSAIARVVRLTGYVASASDFTRQPEVMNGASDFLVDILGERGRHSRLALGTNVLPFATPVEIEMILEVEDGNR
ncbi:MAG: RidA family protein [Spirochaetaceae bacterium]